MYSFCHVWKVAIATFSNKAFNCHSNMFPGRAFVPVTDSRARLQSQAQFLQKLRHIPNNHDFLLCTLSVFHSLTTNRAFK